MIGPRQRVMGVALVVLVAAGCGASPTPLPGSRAPTLPAASNPSVSVAALAATAVAPSASPLADCPALTDGVALDDPASGVSLVMPKGWRQMLPGDLAWKGIFGDDHSVEASIKDGTMQAFALPLGTPDAHLLSLAIYVRPTGVSDVATLGDDYASVIQRFIVTDYAAAALTGEEAVGLPAGDAIRIEAAMHYTGNATPRPDLPSWDDRVLAYVLLKGGHSYYLVFRGKEVAFSRQRDGMGCMAQSLRLTEPKPSASATP